MDYKGCANAPLLALQVRKRGQDEQIECLGEGGRLKAYAASDALLVMRPQPLVASSAGESGAASARIAPDLKLQTHADEQVCCSRCQRCSPCHFAATCVHIRILFLHVCPSFTLAYIARV